MGKAIFVGQWHRSLLVALPSQAQQHNNEFQTLLGASEMYKPFT